jgi:hypothetical protein
MNRPIIALTIFAVIVFHMGLFGVWIWLTRLAPLLGVSLILFWICGLTVLAASYLSKKL